MRAFKTSPRCARKSHAYSNAWSRFHRKLLLPFPHLRSMRTRPPTRQAFRTRCQRQNARITNARRTSSSTWIRPTAPSARHDFDAALAAARQALQLNPDLREAAEIQERIRLGRETHQVEQWLAAAQELLVAGSLTDAQALADQALTVAPGLPAAVKLRESIDAARREAEQNRRRAEALKRHRSRGSIAGERAAR